MNLRSFTMTCVATLAVAMAASAAGQSPAAFPARPVTLVVPFTASSGSDIIARIISPKLAAKWGQPVVVDNKPGATRGGELRIRRESGGGISGALTDLIGGQVEMMFGSVPSLRPHAQSGRLRLLAVTGTTRHPLIPDVPTFKEQGIEVMDTVDAWYAVFAPGRTSPELVARLNADFVAVMNDADVKLELAKLGIAVRTSSPAQLGDLVKSDLVRWQKVVTTAGVVPD